MAIVDRKEGASGPEIYLLELWLDYVQNNRDAIFVIIPHHALMRIGCISDDNTILLRCILRWVIVLSEFDDLLLFHLHIFFSLADSHFHATILNNVVWAHVFLLFLSLSLLSCFLLLSCHRFFGWLSYSVLLLIQTFLERVERVLNNLWLILGLGSKLVLNSTALTFFLVFMRSE